MTETKSMRFSLSSALLLATGFTVAGCGPVNRGLESVNQPVVQRTDYVFDLASGGGISDAEQQRLIGWFDALRLGYGDRISIDDRTASPATHEAIAGIVARYGMLLSDTAPVTAGSAELAGARVVVSRSTASVPDCPDWSRSSQPEFAGSTMSNYGCATNSNLAAMVANPGDLVQGQSAVATDPLTINRAIKNYREAQPTGKGELKKEAASGGGGGN